MQLVQPLALLETTLIEISISIYESYRKITREYDRNGIAGVFLRRPFFRFFRKDDYYGSIRIELHVGD